MIAPSLRFPGLARLFAPARPATPAPQQPAPQQPADHEAAMAHRQFLGEMFSRAPDAFGSDLDVLFLSGQHGGPF